MNQPIQLQLIKLSKIKTHLITFLEKFLNSQNNSLDHHHIYTDGSKQGMKVGCTAISQNQELLKCLPNESSIYSAEVTAIDLVINIIANHKSSKFIILSNSKSVLLALQKKNSIPLIARLLHKMNALSKNNSTILTWIPSHISIHGNERTDKALKKTLLANISNTKIPYTDLKPIINKFILKKWQKSWDDRIHKLHCILYTMGKWLACCRRNRKVIPSRRHIGHTHITHSHLLKGKTPQYAQCA